jgi:hypothetical protein
LTWFTVWVAAGAGGASASAIGTRTKSKTRFMFGTSGWGWEWLAGVRRTSEAAWASSVRDAAARIPEKGAASS